IGWRQEVVSSAKRGAEGGLARVRVPASLEQVEVVGQPIQELIRREQPCPGSGQLDREWKTVEATAQLADDVARRLTCAVAEENSTLVLGQRGRVERALTMDAAERTARADQRDSRD